MEYARFERLVIGGTLLLVLLTVAASIASGAADAAEIIGQLAIVGVMGAAVHWGRKAGTIAALAACLLYLVLRLPMLSAGMTPQAFPLVVSRLAGYCLIGIVGGEVFARVKYLCSGAAGYNVIDDWSRVYNQRYAARALEQAVVRHKRYREPFSMVIIRLEPVVTGSQKPEQLRGLVRRVASFLRDDVRMIDDVAHLDDGRFVVLLPHVPGTAAPAVADRLGTGISQTLGVQRSSVTATYLSAAEDTSALEQFAASIAYIEDEPIAQPASGA